MTLKFNPSGDIVIGIDPDADRHGVAVYRNGRLAELHRWTIMDFIDAAVLAGHFRVGIEDVMTNQFVYRRNQKRSKAMQSKVAMSIGRCQQAQVELMRVMDFYGIEYHLFKPQRGNWAEKKDLFESVTGWDGRSSKDTRSAAFFGYLAIK